MLEVNFFNEERKPAALSLLGDWFEVEMVTGGG
jgi:hypothetical protein